MKPYVKRNYKRGKKVAKKRTTRPVKVSKPIKAYIDKKMKTGGEKKTDGDNANQLALINYNVATQSFTVYDCSLPLQSIAQSAGAGGRVGNKINVTSYKVRGFINITGTTVISNIYFRILCLRLKKDTLGPNGTFNQLYQFGNNVLAPTGSLLDMIRQINRDVYTVYYSKIYLLGSSDAVSSTLAMNNSVGSAYFEFDLKKVFGGKITYNDANAIPTSNKAAWLVFVPCNANGATVSALQMAPYVTTIDTEMFYTDD